MTTITFKEDIKLWKKNFISISEFLWEIDSDLLYEEYLERKLQESKANNNFVNL